MSTSSGFSGSGDFSGKSSSEKTTSFSQTRNKLAQYRKERGSFDKLSLCMETAGSVDFRPRAVPVKFFPTHNHHPVSFFPQQTGFAKEAVHIPSNPSKPYAKEPKTAPMTIFYAGQVIVFNDFPADKAKEVMQLASYASFQNHNNTVPPSLSTTQNGSAYARHQVSSGYRTPPPSPSPTSFLGMNMVPERMLSPKQPIELPIARKISLQRFLERRKERISGKVPYFGERKDQNSSKQAENESWLSLAAQTS